MVTFSVDSDTGLTPLGSWRWRPRNRAIPEPVREDSFHFPSPLFSSHDLFLNSGNNEMTPLETETYILAKASHKPAL